MFDGRKPRDVDDEEEEQFTDDDDDGLRRPNVSRDIMPIVWAAARSNTRNKANRSSLSLYVLDRFIASERASKQQDQRVSW
jgi:hypothetical protein